MRWLPISILLEVSMLFYTFDARGVSVNLAKSNREKVEKAPLLETNLFVDESKERSAAGKNMDFIFKFLSNSFTDEYQDSIENSMELVEKTERGSKAAWKDEQEFKSRYKENGEEEQDQTSANKNDPYLVTPREFGLHGRQNKVFWSDEELVLAKSEKNVLLDNPETAGSISEDEVESTIEVEGITEDIFKVENFKEVLTTPVKEFDGAVDTEKTGTDMATRLELDDRDDTRSSLVSKMTSIAMPELVGEVEEAPAQSRQFSRILTVSSLPVSSIEDMFRGSVMKLPRDIDDAREVIVEEIATRNMLGYTIAVGFFSGAALDTLGDFFVEERFLSELVTDRGLWYKLGWLWFYAAGFAGPWLFPATFNGGDPDLRCSSVDFFLMLSESNLGTNIRSVTSRSQGELNILTENLRVEFNSRLGCIVGSKNKYKEAEAVHATFARILGLMHLHHDLTGHPRKAFDITVVDAELLRIWDSIPTIAQEAHQAVTSRRANTSGIQVFIGLLNLLGAIFGVLMEFEGSFSSFPGGPELPQAVRQTVESFTLNSQFNNSLVLGETLNAVAEGVAWGYSYYMPYFLFLQEADPGCGSEEFDNVYSRYQQLRSFQVLMSSGLARPPVVKYFVSEWRRELGVALHCLLSQNEGRRLGDTLDMFVTLANYRLGD